MTLFAPSLSVIAEIYGDLIGPNISWIFPILFPRLAKMNEFADVTSSHLIINLPLFAICIAIPKHFTNMEDNFCY